MASRAEIVQFADTLLEPASFSDYGPNGLQVVGSAEVTRVCSAVSCTLDVFQRAAESGAQMLLVHHGLFWRDTPQAIDRYMRERLRVLFDNDVNLVAYHLPLDAHPVVGNNAVLCDRLQLARETTPFAVHGGRAIGVIGHYQEPLPLDDFVARVAAATSRAPLVLGARPERVARVAVCSGGAARDVASAIAEGCDAFVTGEPSEPANATAREGDVAFLAAGHHATEVFGVQELGRRIADRFGVSHHFLDVDNPV